MTKIRRPKRIRAKSKLYISFALFSMLAVFFLGTLFFKPKTVQSIAPIETVRIAADDEMVLIPTPARAVARGERISDIELVQIKWPKERLQEDFLLSSIGHESAIAITPLPKFMPIPLSALSDNPLDANAVVEGIPLGMRAITVRVDAESAVEGWASSGNFVDVILIRATRNSEGLEAKIISENVKILSAGSSVKPAQAMTSAPQAPKTVTLLVTQEDALKIRAAQSLGKLTFSLRGRGDGEPVAISRVNQSSILSGAQSVQLKADRYKGYARDDEGRLFVFNDDFGWKKANKLPSTLAVARLNEAVNTAEPNLDANISDH